MNQITTEIKILITSVAASIIIDTEIFIRFLVPIMSAATWQLLKLVYELTKAWRKRKWLQVKLLFNKVKK